MTGVGAGVSVQNVVLGQLIRRRGYGYELADRLRAWTDAFEFSDAAIYAALRQLERRGLIVEVGLEQPVTGDWHRGQRVVFEATEAGRAHFDGWMTTMPRKAPHREELHLQLLVAEEEDVEGLIASLRRLEDDCREHLARVLAMSLDPREAPPHTRISAFGAPLVRDALTSHLQATMDWAQRTRRTLQNRRDGAADGVPGRHRP